MPRPWIAALLGGSAAVLITVAWVAPAQWVAQAIGQASGGRIELANAAGTVWNGEGTLVLSSGTPGEGARSALPDPLSWHLAALPLLSGTVELTVRHPSSLSAPVQIDLHADGRVRIGAMTLHLPAALLGGMGAPWNTVRPGGMLSLHTDGLEVGADHLRGGVTAEWDQASSALTPVAPIGHYRLQTSGDYPGIKIDLQTISGPLELTGSGTIAEGGRIRFHGIARPQDAADPATRNQLSGLISLLGRRQGETAILSLGS